MPERLLQYGLIPVLLILPLTLVKLPFISTVVYFTIFFLITWGLYVVRNKESARLFVYEDHFEVRHPFYLNSADQYFYDQILSEPIFHYRNYRTWFFIRRTYILVTFIYGSPPKNEFIHLNMSLGDFLPAISLASHKLKLYQKVLGDQMRTDSALSARVVDQLLAQGLTDEEVNFRLSEEGLSELDISDAKESYKNFVEEDRARVKRYLLVNGIILISISLTILILVLISESSNSLIFWPSIVLIGGLRLLYYGFMK